MHKRSGYHHICTREAFYVGTKEIHNQYVLVFIRACSLQNQRFGRKDLLVLILYKKALAWSPLTSGYSEQQLPDP